MDGKSTNPQEELLERLKKEFPSVFTDGKVDCKRLKSALGEEYSDDYEQYGLSWTGKSDCFREIQTPTTATLKPDREESVNFDETENLFIEGDNLEVLKILQKPYYGKVKMIYIDPPYNTGNDFIYNDNFKKKREDYLKESGQVDEDGNVRADGLMKNTRDRGHYHSDWMNMMYPRLFLARNLLRDDGVIFVSIDDNEVHNLRMMMNEIFGEENFEGHIHWRRRHNQPNDPTKLIALVAEHILVFSYNSITLKNAGVGKLELTGSFSNPDNDPRGEWNSKPWKVGTNQTGSKYEILLPDGNTIEEEWMGEKSTFNKLLQEEKIYFSKNGSGLPRKKIFKSEREKSGQSASNWFEHRIFGHNQNATSELAELFSDKKNIFDSPKPTKLIKKLVLLGNLEKEETVLDFFAGSGTTAHAVMALNAEDGGNRKCISVQLPELCDEKSEANKAGFKTIADISKERIRRAGNKIMEEREGKLDLDGDGALDIGFKVFKLDESNFKIWRKDIQDEKELQTRLEEAINNVKKDAGPEAILYELVLKSGLDLNAKVEKKTVSKNSYFLVNDGELVVYLDESISEEVIKDLLSHKPQQFVCLDRAFDGNDQLKTNISLQLEREGVEFKVV